MTNTISKVLLAALVAAGSLSALPVTAPAQSLNLYLGPDRGDDDFDRDYRRERRYDDEEDFVRPRRGCSADQAIRRAYRYGMRDPEIAAMTRSRVIVEGQTRRGGYTRLYLANRSGCPRIG
ncbi:hypothetical protein [Ensifer sp.]|uniref:hypothetical protein n=1 Tax=Ensifer sp. TaxID=1872086 RepID=UPI002E135B02|nr:hypothetical protein [Ensifer sp.]